MLRLARGIFRLLWAEYHKFCYRGKIRPNSSKIPPIDAEYHEWYNIDNNIIEGNEYFEFII